MYKIESGVEIPKSPGAYALGQYPWRELKVDESFFIPCDENRIMDLSSRINSSRAYAQKKTGYRFSIRRSIPGHTPSGVRVWRVK